MRYLTIAAISALAVITATPAAADWKYTRWGMTPEQVVAASGGLAVLAPHPSRGSSPTVMVQQVVSTPERDFTISFNFQDNALTIVEMSITRGECMRLIQTIDGAYGPALTSRTTGRPPVDAWQGSWRSEKDNYSIQMMSSGRICHVSYRPLRMPGDNLF